MCYSQDPSFSGHFSSLQRTTITASQTLLIFFANICIFKLTLSNFGLNSSQDPNFKPKNLFHRLYFWKPCSTYLPQYNLSTLPRMKVHSYPTKVILWFVVLPQCTLLQNTALQCRSNAAVILVCHLPLCSANGACSFKVNAEGCCCNGSSQSSVAPKLNWSQLYEICLCGQSGKRNFK